MLRRILCLAISIIIAAGMTACGTGEKNINSTGSANPNSTDVNISANSAKQSISGRSGTGEKQSETKQLNNANAGVGDNTGNGHLNIATLYNDRYMEEAIQEYKKLYPGVTINWRTYAISPNTLIVSDGPGSGGKKAGYVATEDTDPKDVEKFVNTLNTEIMSGKAPDIISVDPLPYRRYADKNLLTDLGSLMDSDRSFDQSRFYKGILDGVRYKGKLYAFPVKFTIDMLVGDSAFLEDPSISFDDSSWTWEDFKVISEMLIKKSGQPDIAALIGVSELELLNYIMGSSYDKFIDMEKKNAVFNNEFKDMLIFCRELLDKKLVNTDTANMTTGRGNTLFQKIQLTMPIDFLSSAQTEFNGNGKLFSLPGSENAGVITFKSDAMLSIYNNSKNKTEAWKFIKFLLSDEIQSDMGLAGFSVNREAVRANATMAVQILKKGNIKIVGPEGEVNVKPATEEDIEEMVKVLEKVNRYQSADREVQKIILEEAESFFSGLKSVDEVTELIQSRVNLYLKE